MLTVIDVPAIELGLGDKIVTGKDRKTGEPRTKSVEVIEVSPRGCPGKVHVNREWCYESFARVDVLRPVSVGEILREMMGWELLTLAAGSDDV